MNLESDLLQAWEKGVLCDCPAPNCHPNSHRKCSRCKDKVLKQNAYPILKNRRAKNAWDVDKKKGLVLCIKCWDMMDKIYKEQQRRHDLLHNPEALSKVPFYILKLHNADFGMAIHIYKSAKDIELTLKMIIEKNWQSITKYGGLWVYSNDAEFLAKAKAMSDKCGIILAIKNEKEYVWHDEFMIFWDCLKYDGKIHMYANYVDFIYRWEKQLKTRPKDIYKKTKVVFSNKEMAKKFKENYRDTIVVLQPNVIKKMTGKE